MGFFDFLGSLSGAVPVVGPILQGVLGGFQGQAQNNAAKAQAQAYNDWLGARESGINDLVARLGERGIDPFGMQTSYGTSYGTTQSDSTTRFNELLRKLVDPDQARLKGKLEAKAENRLDESLSEGEKMRQLKAVNDAFENVTRGNVEAAQMAGGGPRAVAGARAGVDAERARAFADLIGRGFNEQQRSIDDSNQAFARGLLTDWQGQSRSGTSRTTGTTSSQGGSSQTAPPNLTALANLFLPPSPQATGETGQNPWLNAGSDILGGVLQTGQNQGWWDKKKDPLANVWGTGTPV